MQIVKHLRLVAERVGCEPAEAVAEAVQLADVGSLVQELQELQDRGEVKLTAHEVSSVPA